MRVTLAQVDSVLGDIDANIEHAAGIISKASREGSDLVVFPELHLSGYSVGEIESDLALKPTDERLERLAKLAGSGGVVLAFPEAGPGGMHTYNSSAYYQAGQLVHVHRKLYLPNYLGFEERKHFTPGQSMRAFDAGAARLAMMVCNDAWQPQLAFLATQDGAQVLLMPVTSAQSAFPERYDSQGYWRGITRFYGRMCQLFVVFVNRVGAEGTMRFWGGSHVVDPWGNVVEEVPESQEHTLTVDIDLTDVRRRRRDIPLVKEARLGLLQREVRRLLDEGGDL
ncbi:nitrilase-related carbon-nitrogen hydrolase [Phytoactinopolyspora mesophila]|uniref:Amidohydrolase n=1 Tax=Phytoactinopolyspora mesophila TaxID=2650750 RepID=A0A7K3M1S7_9ACTN|nr:nitrilase-related carbon-nitrogen hydrolase [Phytoactinopolyspora mesophila]NDL57229.1 amidohydrolase [Phytoactinopolyspora mesophila]